MWQGLIRDYWPAFLAMGMLIVGSAFFSSSEAAFFYLGRAERQHLATAGRRGRAVLRLLRDSERLLTAVLFWNLVINVAYFATASIVTLRLEHAGLSGAGGAFSVAALVMLIICSEVLPKSIAVMNAPLVATWWSLPLASAVRVVDPLLPWLRTANLLSRRLLFPQFRGEPYLRASDLQRALRLSTSDATLLQQEQQVLQAIVYLSEIRADELMRPRSRLESFAPPIRLAELEGKVPACGYLLVRDPEADQIVAALALKESTYLPENHLERLASPVAYVPWCTTVADALETMQRQQRRVAAVVNEYGDTIGILTFDDIVDTLFGRAPSRTKRLLNREPIWKVGEGVWMVAGITILKRLERAFGRTGPPHRSLTVAGIVQEILERLPEVGDRCQWGPYAFEVVDEDESGQWMVRLTLVDEIGKPY